MAKTGGFGRSLGGGALAGAVIVVLTVLAVAFLPEMLNRTPERADVFVLVVAGPGEDGVAGARIIAEIDLKDSPPSVTAKDPAAAAEIAGTTYDRVSDAYAFGGGAAVVQATYSTPLPYVAIEADRFAELVEKAGGLEVDLPEDMEVFTGEELLSFRKGRRELDGDEAFWVLEGSAYLGRSVAKSIREQVAEEAVRAVSEAPGGVARLVAAGQAKSDTTAEALPNARLFP